MSKTKLVLLLAAVFAFASAVCPQSPDNITFKVAIVDKALNLRNVPKFVVAVRKVNDPAFADRKVSTGFDGSASLSLTAGEYIVRSENALAFENKSFAWEVPFRVSDGAKF